MIIKNFFSLSNETDQSKAGSYLAPIAVVLIVGVLAIPDVQARGLAPYEIVVYEGKPVDYSNRSDVIFIDDSSPQNYFSNLVTVQSYASSNKSKPKTIAKRTSLPSRTKALSIKRPTQPKAIPRVATKPIPRVVKSMSVIAQNELMTKNKTVMATVNGKDPQLVAFYLDVFGKQQKSFSKQATPAKRQAVKRNLIKNIVRKKSKPNKVQLLLVASKGKDPELVAFYKHVFRNNKYSPSKQAQSVIVVSKAKDPELVAFYKQVFGSKKRMPAVAKNGKTKMNIANNSKQNQKRHVKNTKGKTTVSKRVASVEMQQLLDTLKHKKLI